MSDLDKLKDDISFSLNLSNPNSSGFMYVDCPICGRRQKGGFKFESDKVIYNCFRASCDSSSVLTEGEYVSKKFRNLMDTIDVQIPPSLLLGTNNTKNKFKELLDEDLYDEFIYESLDVSSFDSLKNFNGEQPYQSFITDNYLPEYPYKIAPNDFKWDNRLIIPSFYNGKLIGLIGKSIDGNFGKYLNEFGNTHGLFIRNGKVGNTAFVFEGPLDALFFPNGVATLGNRISKKQAYVLSKYQNVVIIPDRDYYEDYLHAAEQYDYVISVPEWGDCKDAFEAVKRYGRIAVQKMILDGIEPSTYKARLKLQL